jgi:hypothetical protein
MKKETTVSREFGTWTTPDSVIRSDASRNILFRASTPTIDRYGTIIKPMGIDTKSYKKNPIFVWGHDSARRMDGEPPDIKNVLGKTVRWTKQKKAFDAEVEFAEEEVNPRGHQALVMVKAGYLNASSIRFKPKKWHEEEIDGKRIIVFDRVELYDIALVTLPGNKDTLVLARDMALDLGADADDVDAVLAAFREEMAEIEKHSRAIPSWRLDQILDDEEEYEQGEFVRRDSVPPNKDPDVPPTPEVADSGIVRASVQDALSNRRIRSVIRSVLKPFSK